MTRRLALVRYTVPYFLPFGRALEDRGFEVYWVSSHRSDAACLVGRGGIPASRVLDVTSGFDPSGPSAEACRATLAAYEEPGSPRMHDIIMMDRILRRQPADAALRYLRHVHETLRSFFVDRGIELVSSGRDTALNLASMLVSRSLGIPWVVPTRLRIPRETYGFCSGHDTADFVKIRDVTADDRGWAAGFVDDFARKEVAPPALKKAARGFSDVAAMLPLHARLFWTAVKASRLDAGNRLTRYSLGDLVRMYVGRRRNLFAYQRARPWRTPGASPFCLYALHTQPESSIDVAGSYFSDQAALVTFIARSLPVSHELYVKVHPTDVDGQPLSFYRRLAAVPGVRLINYDVDSRTLVQRASIVFTLTGTIGYEAALAGKPVVTFARNYFNGLPTVSYCDAPPRLPGLIDAALAMRPDASTRLEIIEAVAALRASAFDGEINREYGEHPAGLTAADLAALQDAYDAVYSVLVSRRREQAAPLGAG